MAILISAQNLMQHWRKMDREKGLTFRSTGPARKAAQAGYLYDYVLGFKIRQKEKTTRSVLLIISKPDVFSPPQQQSWSRIQEEVAAQLDLYKDMKKINESTLEIALKNGLPAFVNILHVVQGEKFPYQVLFYEENPQWIHQTPK
jgi:hypothetical protein